MLHSSTGSQPSRAPVGFADGTWDPLGPCDGAAVLGESDGSRDGNGVEGVADGIRVGDSEGELEGSKHGPQYPPLPTPSLTAETGTQYGCCSKQYSI